MTTTLRAADLQALRLHSLLLTPSAVRSPASVVEWFGAMQAQDVGSGEWSFGARSTGMTQREVHQATVDRSIVRTWPMRGTVHFVPPRDAMWMLDLTGVRALNGAARRREFLGLTEAIVDQAADVLRSALSGGKAMSRAECVETLLAAGIPTASEHVYHLLWYSSQIGVTCIGPQRAKEQTFVRLDEWVPDPVVLSRDEALAELALRFYRSHGPATVADFVRWTGLTTSDTKRAIALLDERIAAVDVEGTPMFSPPELLDQLAVARRSGKANVMQLLPGFDEFVLGYKDRSAFVEAQHMDAIVPGNNGVFMPTMVWHGRVVGTWRRAVKRQRVELRALPFAPLTSAQLKAWRTAGDAYGRYLELETVYPE